MGGGAGQGGASSKSLGVGGEASWSSVCRLSQEIEVEAEGQGEEGGVLHAGHGGAHGIRFFYDKSPPGLLGWAKPG